MVSFLKSRNTWVGRIICKRAKLSLCKTVQKKFDTKQEAADWESNNKDRIRNEIMADAIVEHKNKLGIRRAISMYINGERQEEINDAFAEIGINISDYLVPTKSIPRTQREIAKEFGVTQQYVQNTMLPSAYKKARFELKRFHGWNKSTECDVCGYRDLNKFVYEYHNDYDGLDEIELYE